jgi:valyl-tRNA synthetase
MDWDWIISRQRVYGTPIPFWVCENCGQIYTPTEEELPVNPSIEEYKKGKCDCEGKLIGETDICDGWVDSTVSPLIVSGYWKNDEELFKKLFPNDLRQQGHDIIRTWAYYTILRSLLETGRKPWKKILINGMVYGPDGRQMHKSWGNVITPDEVLKKQGADTIRAGLIMMGLYGNDGPFAWKDMEFTYRFLTKLWNIFRFSEKHITNVKKSEPTLIDSWILTKLQKIEETVSENYDNFIFSKSFDTLHNFVWHTIADNYLEMIKYRIYDEENKEAAAYTLRKVLKNIIKMLAPIIPYITEELWQQFFNDEAISIHSSSWPEEIEKDGDAEEIGDMAVSIITYLRQYKNKRGMALNAELEKVVIDCDAIIEKRLERIFDDLRGTMKIKTIEFGSADTQLEDFPIRLSVVLPSE